MPSNWVLIKLFNFIVGISLNCDVFLNRVCAKEAQFYRSIVYSFRCKFLFKVL